MQMGYQNPWLVVVLWASLVVAFSFHGLGGFKYYLVLSLFTLNSYFPYISSLYVNKSCLKPFDIIT